MVHHQQIHFKSLWWLFKITLIEAGRWIYRNSLNYLYNSSVSLKLLWNKVLFVLKNGPLALNTYLNTYDKSSMGVLACRCDVTTLKDCYWSRTVNNHSCQKMFFLCLRSCRDNMAFLDLDYRFLHIFVPKWMEVGWLNIFRK